MKITVFILLLGLILIGCGKSDERNHPLYQKAVKAQNSGNGSEAAELFNELLKRRPRSVYAHLKLAGVYDELLNDPAMAALHYRKYLAAAPDAPDAEEVQAWIVQAEKRNYKLLKERFETAENMEKSAPEPMPPIPAAAEAEATEKSPENSEKSAPEDSSARIAADSSETAQKNETAEKTADDGAKEQLASQNKKIAELEKLLTQYRLRHDLMRQELERLRQRLHGKNSTVEVQSAPAVTNTAAAAAPESAGTVRTYKVVPGDTPGGIARKVYGKSSLYTLIMRANPKLDARKMRPGMVLVIPEITEKKQ